MIGSKMPSLRRSVNIKLSFVGANPHPRGSSRSNGWTRRSATSWVTIPTNGELMYLCGVESGTWTCIRVSIWC